MDAGELYSTREMVKMTLQELIESIYALNNELKKFEAKYGVASPDFYDLFLQGRLDDGEYEDTEEFCMWAGIYETRLDQEQQFRRLSQEYIATLV